MHTRQPSLIRSRLILIGVVALIVIAGALWVFGPNAPSRSLPPTPTLAPAPAATFALPPDLSELARRFPRLEKLLTNPALDSVYKEFLVAYESGGVEAAELMARQRGLLTDDNQIRMTLVLDTTDSAALVQELSDIGVIVRGTYRDLIDIGIPLELIARTAEADNPGAVFDQITQLEHVIGLQLPAPKPAQPSTHLPANSAAGLFQLADPVTGEGVQVINAQAWHAAGFTGVGVKIGVLDQGFDHYQDLLGSSLPAEVTVQSFVPGIQADQTGSAHGTAVAEIVHDIAPGAELVLAHYDGGDVSMGNAVDWLVQQGVQIITHSAGGLAAPMDGTGRDAELVDRVAEAGILWVNSAGNAAAQHYRGSYTDTNGDLIHEFAPDKTTLGFQSNPDGLTQIVLNWDDWRDDDAPADAQDLDLYLLDADSNIIASARNTREGGRDPVEQILYQFDDSRTYFLTINGVSVDRALRLDLYIHQTSNLELADATGSLATPGDARGAFTVGAVFWHTDEVEAYSSRGPTADGRVKPDLVGPDGIASHVFAPDRFFGTSAAAPHIAGAAALVWGAYPSATADEIRQYLSANTIDLLEPGVDATTGAGRLQLPAPPVIEPTTTPTATPADSPLPSAPAQTVTAAPTATPRKIALGTPTGSRPRPPITAPADRSGDGWMGLVAIGLAAVLAAIVGWRVARRAPRSIGPAATRSVTAASLVCTHCGRVLPAEASFCAQCGRPVGGAQTQTKCARCDRALRPGARYCARCGQPVTTV